MTIQHLTRATLAATLIASFSQAALADVPADIQVPDGHSVALETVGVGAITYMCEAKDDGSLGWVFKGPHAALNDREGNQVGSYYGPPATWEALDGSKVTATQLAVSPNGDGNIPLQLVEANPAEGEGAMNGVSYIQRLDTQGGVAPNVDCGTDNEGATAVVTYQADYIFWTAN
ncbi:DUF3455 domain-containing protein [Vreelandella lutescens]|uniref:DUF3455 domain-containing protein n=1 Tax=Vreelandella lutescens TaxID=1602943 RepID=A0ABQ1PJX4_9GAMM|nr:DUF3455 domain-containing protein [Halomonas lutescens]GGC98299.1 hypothetical protein GCM10011382_31050 [Halomonas lutescens]